MHYTVSECNALHSIALDYTVFFGFVSIRRQSVIDLGLLSSFLFSFALLGFPSMLFFLHHFPLGTKAGKGRNKEKAKKNKEAKKKKTKDWIKIQHSNNVGSFKETNAKYNFSLDHLN